MVMVLLNSCSIFCPKYHPLQQAGGRKTLPSPGTPIHGVISRNQYRKSMKCSQFSSYYLNNKIRNSEDISNRNRKPFNKLNRVPVTLQDGSASKPNDDNNSTSLLDVLLKKLDAFYRFTRPYSLIGTMIAVTSVSLLPLQSVSDLTPKFFMGLLKALVPTALILIYENGLNQVYDVEIDKVNKPYLPLASGEFSMGTGIALVAASAVMSLAMGIMFQSPPLLSALVIIFLLGSAYSVDLPFLRWKRNSFLTALYITTAMGIVYQFGFFSHIQNSVLGRPLVITKSLMFATAIVCCLCVAIALLKDLPDEEGDREHGIRTLTVILGKKAVFSLCVSLLLIAYGGAVTVGASSSFLLSKLVTIIGHSTLAAILWLRARSVDLSSQESTHSFYMFIWKLYYAEYLLIPFVR